MTRDEIITRLKANGNPSVFEEHVLKLIQGLESECHLKHLNIVRRDKRIAELEHQIQVLSKPNENINAYYGSMFKQATEGKPTVNELDKQELEKLRANMPNFETFLPVPPNKEYPKPIGKIVNKVCGVCGHWQLDTPSGPTCNNGHGGASGISYDEFKQRTNKDQIKTCGHQTVTMIPSSGEWTCTLCGEKVQDA